MSRIFLDTNIFIYLIEDRGPLGQAASDLVGRAEQRNDDLVTSAITLGEVFVKPFASNDNKLLALYQKFFDSGEIEVISFDHKAALHYGKIRIDRGIKAPDAIQLACAAAANCDLFVTNDDRLSKKIVPGIQFITSLDRVPI